MNGRVTGWVLALLCMKTINGLLITKLVITNDGPTILDANTTFTARLTFANQTAEERSPPDKKLWPEPRFMYRYVWEQHICGERKVVEINQNRTCNFSQVYTCPEDVGWRTVTVTVSKNTFLFPPFVAANTSIFQVTEHINANLTVSHGVSCNSTFNQTKCYVVATNTSVDMGVNIYDPSHFFQGATVLYHWVFGDGSANTQINQPTISHIYRTPGQYGITVNMTAIFKDSIRSKMTSQPKTGNLMQNLKTMDAIKTLTIRGKTELAAGTKSSYNISCRASLPVKFCWYVIPTTTHTSGTSPSYAKSCNATTLTDRTWLVVDHWFNNSGGYNIGVYANNAISRSNSNKNVRAENPNRPKAIMGLTFGILLGIAGCILSIVVVTTYMRRQNRRHVEVANFDFQARSGIGSSLATKIHRFILGGRSKERIPLSTDFNKNQMT